MPSRLVIIEVCKEMHWTYQQYLENPPGFNDDMFMTIMEVRKEEARKAKG